MKKQLSRKLLSIVLTMAIVIGYAVPGTSIAIAESNNVLPNGFTNVAIGNSDGTGDVKFNQENGSFTVTGSGLQIGKDIGKSDSYQFISTETNGDATIVARLVDFDLGTSGQAGIVIRDDNKSINANYMGVYVDAKKVNYRAAYRNLAMSKSGATNFIDLDTSKKDLFIKIEKKGTKFNAYIAEDKSFDTVLAKNTKTINTEDDKWNVGFFVSNGSNKTASTASFDNIVITDNTGLVYESNSVVDGTTPEESLPEESTPEEIEGFIPKGFLNSNIGNNEENVYAGYNQSTKKFVVEGSGTYIGKDTGVNDNYQFVNYKLTGNVSITAKLSDYDMTNAIYGQAGVFIREDNSTDNANYFGLYVEPSKNTFRYAYRDNSVSKSGAANITSSEKGYYLKVQREDTKFTYYLSKYKNFPAESTFKNTQTINSSSDTWYVGFVVSNGEGSTSPAVATFEDIKIENQSKVYFDSTQELVALDTVENLATISSDKKVTLTWDAVDGATNYTVKRATKEDGKYTQIAIVENNTEYVDQDVINFTKYYYKVVANNEDGSSHDSKAVMAIPNNSNSEHLQYGEDAAKFTMTEEPEDTVFTSQIEIKGYADKDGSITIKQDGIVRLEANKVANEEFSRKFNLKKGRNTIEIYHTTEDNKTTLKTYNIVYLSENTYNMIVDSNYDGVDGAEVNGIKTYKTVAAAVAAVNTKNTNRVTIFIKNGVYKEKLTIESPYISLIGEDSQKTILTYDDANKTINPDTGEKYGTSKSASVTIKSKAKGFSAENLTIENGFEELGEEGEQAVALNNQADQSMFINCRFIGNQDTLLADASSSSPARQYYYNCYIEGDVDFIFGRAQAVFDNCDIVSVDRGSTTNNGYITAADTWDRDAYGYLIINSRLLGEEGIADNSVSLGRPWRPSSAAGKVTPSVTYVNTYMGPHITTKGWDDMGPNSPASTARFNEFGSFGKGAKFSDTRPVLSLEDRANYTLEKVFAKDSASAPLLRMAAYANDWNPTLSTDLVSIKTLYGAIEGEIVPEIGAESIVLDKTNIELQVGQTDKIIATVLPEYIVDKEVVFTSSDENIATVDENGNIEAKNVGTVTIVAKAGDVEAKCTVTVVKLFTEMNIAPIILAKDVVIKVGDEFDAKSYVKASDKEDGDLTSEVEILENTVNTATAGEYKVVYKVTDSKGASATKTIKVTVNPKFTLINRVPEISAEDRSIIQGTEFDVRANVSAKDYEDGDLTSEIEVLENTVDINVAGEYKVVYKVTDSKGASATKTIKVTVLQKLVSMNTAPTISAEDVVIKVGDEFDAKSYVKASDKEDGDLTLEVEILENTVNTATAGEYKVVYKVTDSKGASATKTIKVNVVESDEVEDDTPDDGNESEDGDASEGENTPDDGNESEDGDASEGENTPDDGNESEDGDASEGENTPEDEDKSEEENVQGDENTSEEENTPEVDNNQEQQSNNTQVENSPQTGDAGVLGMSVVLIGAMTGLYTINRRRFK